MSNFARELADAASDRPTHPAVRLDAATISFRDLDAAAASVAGFLLGRGISAGDRVGMLIPNHPHFAALYFGALRAGTIVVPMNPLLKAREIEHQLRDSGAKLLFAWHELLDGARRASQSAGAACIPVSPAPLAESLGVVQAVHELADRRSTDPAIIIYTSGTTGTPKGATLTHANLSSSARSMVQLLGSDEHSVFVGVLPLFHIFGMNAVMNSAVLSRGCVTLVMRFTPEQVLEVVERDGATVFAGVPTMYAGLLNSAERRGYDMSTLDVCVSGGAAMPVEVLRSFDEAFGAQILEGYGLSETTGLASFNRRDSERKAGSIGLPVEGTEMRVVDDNDNPLGMGEAGEIVMRGPLVMSGYWGREDATREVMKGGWFHTGDIGTIDADGYITIVDRKKDLIIRGGYNVYPREIEEVLYEHPAVREAAVVGIAHDTLGEEVGAAIALKENTSATADELQAFTKSRVASYKYPRMIWFVDDLPKGPTGKILKREIAPPDSR